MADRVKGKVAFITGAARGQGRSHAVRLAEEGADIIAIDLCAQIDTVHYPRASQADLDQTVDAVQAVGGRIVASVADVRDYDAVKAAVDAGVGEFGRLDIVCANAGIVGYSRGHEIQEKDWTNVIDTNLTGAWHTAKAAIPHMIESGGGGSIIITSSASGIHAYENLAHYVSSKHGQVGLMRTLALELGPHGERAKDAYRLHRLLPAPVVDHQQGVLAGAGAVHPMQPAVHAEPGLIEPSHLTPRLKEPDQLQCRNPT